MITRAEADALQALHDQRQRDDPDNHDDIGCWCCCWTCKFDVDEDETAEILADPTVMAQLKESEEAIARGDTLSVEELAADLLRLRGIDVSRED